MDHLVVNTDYLQIFARSIGLAATTAALTLAIAFPIALVDGLPAAAAGAPSCSSSSPCRSGRISWCATTPGSCSCGTAASSIGLLQAAGLTHEPLNVLYSPLATGIGLVYSFLPFMILPIYVSLEKLDRRLIEAAFDLGADRWRALTRIILPLSMPGIVGGLILVFVPCLGAFVTPALLGGGKSLMIGSLIQQQFGQSRNWPFGAALAFVLLALILCALLLACAALSARRGAPRMTRAGDLWRFPGTRAAAFAVLAYLYLPIVVLVVLSFNASDSSLARWEGFSTHWYAVAAADGNMVHAIEISLIVACVATLRRHDRRDLGGARDLAHALSRPDRGRGAARAAAHRAGHRGGDRHPAFLRDGGHPARAHEPRPGAHRLHHPDRLSADPRAPRGPRPGARGSRGRSLRQPLAELAPHHPAADLARHRVGRDARLHRLARRRRRQLFRLRARLDDTCRSTSSAWCAWASRRP